MQFALPFTVTQRWRHHRASYRPAGEPIDPTHYEIAPIPCDRAPRAFVAAHHYLRSYPAARWRFGLYRRETLVGVAVLSHPCSDRVLTSVFPGEASESVELGRFVLLDEVPANGESWFLARVIVALRREGLIGLLSFSDPVPRTTLDGRVIHVGHVGTCLQATSHPVYLGRSTARTLRLLPDGRTLSERAIQKIRAGERGWLAAAAALVRFGAAVPGEDRATWLATWVPRLTRPLRHAGNHRFAWVLQPSSRALRRQLEAARQPYPKHVV
jgi:hypothetical protein